MTTSGLPAVELKLAGERPGRPPLVRYVVDAVLRNAADAPRWFVLPTNLPPRSGGGVDVLEVFQAGGKGRVVVGRFLGNGGFQALLLPAHAELTLHQLPLSYWGDPPATPVSVEVVIATEITVGGAPVRGWFGAADPTCDARADVDHLQEKMLAKKKSDDGKEQAVTLVEDRRVTVSLSLRP